ncbi:hypothetical protein [Hymenobacter elongatus]|uniref:Outer membrane protein beta-barrel domain-containing protein n=1 Tax=Hymenobacter elongatus TaxID=877208 RepID=A0A4Z0PHL3_9BACT|nr:hypothetical protein [Hymenobacter elongatus]TGE14581.1 hypothetical protein E5J99_15605 [Hymenobacter elongatus]
MVPSANNHTPTPEPTGDLEQLFRQKLGEAEVAPRLQLWEQIDHELLIQQNETYRRRLVWHRWAAAACILLFLGAGSWFTLRQAALPGTTAEVAVVTSPAEALRQRTSAAGTSLASARSSHTATPEADERPVAAGSAGAANSGVGSTSQNTRAELASMQAVAGTVTLGRQDPSAGLAASAGYTQELDAATRSQSLASGNSAGAGRRYTLPVAFSPAASTGSFFDRVAAAASHSYAETIARASSFAGLMARNGVLATGSGSALPGHHPDTLKLALPGAPVIAQSQALAATATAPTQKEQPETLPARPKRWRLLGSYGASAYNPNMSFASASGAGAPSMPQPTGVGPSTDWRSANTYDKAAQEYRQNLRPGFAQRVALTVSYAATMRWTMSAGLAAAEQRATSQTSYYFLDGRIASTPEAVTSNKYVNLAPPRTPQLRTAQYRYRTAGIPVSLRYGSAKNGVSLYAKVGAAVHVLLQAHSELEGAPEATTTYSLTSAGSPYRKVQSSLNGGAGVRYKPATAQWSLAVGPTAEAGLSTLNVDAAQSSSQARPYAFGLEASMEFGGKAAAVAH